MLIFMKNPLTVSFKKISLAIFLCLGVAWHMHSQQSSNSFIDNVRFGGSINIGFGDGFFTAGLAPSAIYDFNQYWSTGFGISGSYSNSNNATAYTAGAALIGFFRPYENLRLSAEFEQLYVNLKQDFNNGRILERDYTYPALFLGLGYTAGFVTAGIKYDVLYNENDSIYGSALVPFVSVYF